MKYTLFMIIILINCYHCNSQSIVYVSESNGSDYNDGLSVKSPKKTIRRLEPKTIYLLHRGDTFSFPIRKIKNPSVKNKIIIASYGKGLKPIISLYKNIKPNSWEKYQEKIWRVDLKNPESYIDFTDTNRINTNVGFLKIGNVIFGRKQIGLNSLNNDWDFYSDNQYLYIYQSDKTKMNSSILIATNECIIQLSDNLEIRDLRLTGTGGHAIQGVNVSNIIIKNVFIEEIGGSILPGFGNGTVRYGNGIEFWEGASNCLVKNCTILQVYDSGLTMQGNGVGTIFKNVTFKNNKISKCEQSFEFWIKGYKSGFNSCVFERNFCDSAGLGWSHSVRVDKKVGVHILNYNWEVNSSDLVIKKNTFKYAKSGYMFINYYFPTIPLFESLNNKIYLDENTPKFITNSKNNDFFLRMEKKTVFIK